VIVQMGFGLRASVTSASTGDVEPCITNSASCVAGAPGQELCRAAQAGTARGLAAGDGDGEGVGVGVGDGLGEGEATGKDDGDGLERATTGPFAVQAAAASRTPMSTNPLLMRD
jgi:hypothetical protein